MFRQLKRWELWTAALIIVYGVRVACAQNEPLSAVQVDGASTAPVTDSSSSKLLGPISSAPRLREREISLVRGGMFAGRSGVAKGGQIVIEINPVRWFGVYGTAGRSGISGYKTKDPDAGLVTARERDTSFGGGAVFRLPSFKRFTFGGFGQVVYAKSNVYATYNVQYPDPSTPGGVANIKGDFRENRSGTLGTVGGQIETPRWRFVPSVVVRVGKNFGDGLAADTWRGVYLGFMPMIDLTRSVQRGLKFAKLIHWGDPKKG